MLIALEATQEASLGVEVEDEGASGIGMRDRTRRVPLGQLYPHSPLLAFVFRLERARRLGRATRLEVSLRGFDSRGVVRDFEILGAEHRRCRSPHERSQKMAPPQAGAHDFATCALAACISKIFPPAQHCGIASTTSAMGYQRGPSPAFHVAASPMSPRTTPT